MKKNIMLLVFMMCAALSHGQKIKLKNTINYNAFGMDVLPIEQLMVGGNHVFYKSFGFGLSYRFGINDFLAPGQFGNPLNNSGNALDSIISNNLFTSNSRKTYSFIIAPSFVIALTHKIPLYIGAGITRQRVYREYLEKGSGEKYWTEDKRDDKILPTFTIGTFIPIYHRVLLNIAYDHLPQSLFIGISIRSWDSWDEFN